MKPPVACCSSGSALLYCVLHDRYRFHMMISFLILVLLFPTLLSGGDLLSLTPFTLRSERQVIADAPGGGGGAVIQALAWNPQKKLHVLAGTGGNGIWYSANGGALFRPAEGLLLSDVKDIHFSVRDSSTVYALVAAAEKASYTATRKEGVWRSRDGGETWEFLVQAPLETGLWGAMIAELDRGGDRIIAVGTHGRGILTGNVDEHSWRWRSCGRKGWIAGIAAVGNVLLAATSEGVFRSADGGEHFKEIPSLRRVQFVSPQGAVFAVRDGEPPVVFLAWPERGVYASKDLGMTWEPFGPASKTTDPPRFFGSIYAHRTVASSPLIGFLKYPEQRITDNILIISNGGDRLRIPDGISDGSRFRTPNRFLGEALVFHPDMAEIMLAGIDRELMKSPDGGITWNAWGAGLYGWGCGGSHFMARVPLKKECFYLALNGAGLWYTSNGGKSFQNVLKREGECVAVACHPGPEEKLVFSWWRNRGKWVVQKTGDGGASWFPVLEADAGPGSFLFHPFKPDVFFAGGYMTTDRGRRFRKLDVAPLAVFKRTGGRVYGVQEEKGLRVVASDFNPAALAWKNVSKHTDRLPGVPLCALVHPDHAERLFLGTTSGLFELSGTAWKPCAVELLPRTARITSLQTGGGDGRLIVASVRESWLRKGGFLMSTDKGKSWTYTPAGFPVLGLCPFGVNRFLAAADIGLFVVEVNP